MRFLYFGKVFEAFGFNTTSILLILYNVHQLSIGLTTFIVFHSHARMQPLEHLLSEILGAKSVHLKIEWSLGKY